MHRNCGLRAAIEEHPLRQGCGVARTGQGFYIDGVLSRYFIYLVEAACPHHDDQGCDRGYGGCAHLWPHAADGQQHMRARYLMRG